MTTRNLRIISILTMILLSASLLAACGSGSSAATNAPSPNAPTSGSTVNGQAIMMQACSACHNISRVTSAQKDATQWKMTVDRMIARGAQVSPQDEQTLIDYLAATYK